MKKLSLILVLLMAVSSITFAGKRKDKANRQVSMFGVSVSLTDSTAFITDIQTIDSLLTNKDGFVDNEKEYSLQLKLYLGKMEINDHTCAVFYDSDMKKLLKKYKKVNTRIRSKEKRKVTELKSSDFKFVLYKEDEEEQ